MSAYPRKLRRSVTDYWIGGVCGGIGEFFDIDPIAVRVGYVLLSILSAGFPGLLVYIVLWLMIPREYYY